MRGDEEMWDKQRELYEKIDGYEARIQQLLNEVNRLKRGEFTEEEFQNLCHNFSEDDVCRFKKGCEEYQKKLFGDKA